MKLRATFQSPYDQYAERRGEAFAMQGRVDKNIYDYSECGPMYNIHFIDGTCIQAWPEEVYSGTGWEPGNV